MRTLLLLLTLVLFTFTVNAQSYEGWPCKWVVQKTSMNVGMINKGSAEKVTYPFINDGTEPLVISGFKGSTGDINIIVPEGPIKPGSKAVIIVELNTKTSGKFREKIELQTNCQKKPIVLEFFGSVGK